jgi:hypothetical protein
MTFHEVALFLSVVITTTATGISFSFYFHGYLVLSTKFSIQSIRVRQLLKISKIKTHLTSYLDDKMKHGTGATYIMRATQK